MSDEYFPNDHQRRENRRALIDPVNLSGSFERAFFKTVAGPGDTPYPAEGSGATVYRAARLKNVSFAKIPGNQTLEGTETANYELIKVPDGSAYVPIGTKLVAFHHGAQWHSFG